MNVSAGSGALERFTDRMTAEMLQLFGCVPDVDLSLEGADEHKLSIGPDQWIALKDVTGRAANTA